MSTDLPRRTWTSKEVAAVLGIPQASVLKLLRAGRLGHVKAGRHYLVPVEELDRYLSGIKYGAA